MEIQSADLLQWMGNLFWPFLRIGAIFIALPVFGARTVPVRVRIILALFLAVVLQPSLPPQPVLNVISASGLYLVLQQLLIGLAMGFVFQITFSAILMAGQVIATVMGLGFASTVDPQNGVQVTMLGQFYIIVATLIFLGADCHLLLIQLLAQTFETLPVGGDFLYAGMFSSVVSFASSMFSWAAIIALPVITGVLLVNLSFGVMTRAAPQLNIFSLGFPMAIIAGFVFMLLSIPAVLPVLNALFMESLVFVQSVFG